MVGRRNARCASAKEQILSVCVFVIPRFSTLYNCVDVEENGNLLTPKRQREHDTYDWSLGVTFWFPTKSTVGYDNQAELAPSCTLTKIFQESPFRETGS